MDPQFVQNLRYKLQKRVSRLNSVDPDMFIPALRQFWRFFDGNSTYKGVAELLTARFPTLIDTVDRIFRGESRIGDSEEESAAMGYLVLRRWAEMQDPISVFSLSQGLGVESATRVNEALEVVRDGYLEPFYEFVDEQLDDQRAMLVLLLRYKHRCEWFHRERLWAMQQQDSRKAEKLLALDLYAYLYDQGIDLTIEPSSLTGEIDLIAAQGSDDPLLADTKIFDGDARGKSYIRKAFNQIYTYTQQYNEPFGYLVIFKVTDKDLRLSLSMPSHNIPVVVYNHKTIFLLTVDIFDYPKPVSQRDPLKAVEIIEAELITPIPEAESIMPIEAKAPEKA